MRPEASFSEGTMKVAIVVNQVTNDREANFSWYIHKCARDKTGLVLFPEAAITGLSINDDPLHDIPLGAAIPGRFTNALSEVAKSQKIYIAIGILERKGDKLYDSAILITPEDGIVLKYRRMTSGWHSEQANPRVYCEGGELKKAETPALWIN